MANPQQKRIIIILIYLALFSLLGYGIYSYFKVEPSCSDKIQNQNEEGVDCGGVCANACAVAAEHNLVVEQSGFVPSGAGNNYDIYAVVNNPNQTLGSKEFQYKFSIKNASGIVVMTKNGNGFILPGETKYIVETNLSLPETPSGVELSIASPAWTETNDLYEKPQLKVVNKAYNETNNGVDFSEAVGLLKNESPLDFSSIKVEIILKDSQDKVLALNSTQLNTVQSGQNRDFRVAWPNRFPGSVANMEVQTEVNVFDSEAFVKKYFKPAKFQQY